MSEGMKDKHQIGECEWCGEQYCMHCSDAKIKNHYCSEQCEKEHYIHEYEPSPEDEITGK